MKISNSTKELTNAINSELFNFLNRDFKGYLSETEKEMIYKYVYSYAASPSAMKKRRYGDDGLADVDNIEVIPLTEEGACLFVNKTEAQDVNFRNEDLSLAEAVETGDSEWNMQNAGDRPFTRETVKKMASDRRTYSIFKSYFNNLGVETKRIK